MKEDDGMLGGLAGMVAMMLTMVLPVVVASLCPIWWLKAAIMISWVVYIFGSILTSSIQQMLDGQANLPMRLGVGVTNHVDSWIREKRERRILRQQLQAEWAGVPNGAISRAQPPGEPQPTAASLSRAEAPEEKKSMLVSAVEEAETYETVSVSA